MICWILYLIRVPFSIRVCYRLSPTDSSLNLAYLFVTIVFIQLCAARVDHDNCCVFYTWPKSHPRPAIFCKAMRRPAVKVGSPYPLLPDVSLKFSVGLILSDTPLPGDCAFALIYFPFSGNLFSFVSISFFCLLLSLLLLFSLHWGWWEVGLPPFDSRTPHALRTIAGFGHAKRKSQQLPRSIRVARSWINITDYTHTYSPEDIW